MSKTMLNVKLFCIIKIDFTKIKKFDKKIWINETVRYDFIKCKKKKPKQTNFIFPYHLPVVRVACGLGNSLLFIPCLQAERKNAKSCNKNLSTCLTKPFTIGRKR